jgi:hypothetical protein
MPFVGYRKGREYELDNALATSLIKDGLVEAVKAVAEPEVVPEPVKAKRGKRARANIASNV